LGLAAVGFICFSLAQLLLQGWPGTAGPATSGPLGSGLVVLLLLVLGGAATALFVTLPVGRRLPRVLMGPVAAGVVVGLVATGEFSPTSEFGLWALAVAVWGAVALLVVMVLSPGLNRGRTLVGHRA
jgi:hypothetical protein